MSKNLLNRLALGTGALVLAAGCAHSVKRAEYPAEANPQVELANLEQQVQAGETAQLDVLAPKDFKRSQKYLDKAKEGLRDNDDRDDVLEDLGYAKAYLQKANETADERRPRVAGILESRMAVLDASVREFPVHEKKLKKIDSDFADLADDKTIDPEDFAEVQKEYGELELATIQSKELGDVRSSIDAARKLKAERYAPQSLKRSETAYANAMNTIASTRRNPASYTTAVQSAKDETATLSAVLAEQKNANWDIKEDVALNLVNQKRSIASLDNQLAEEKSLADARAAQLQNQGSTIQNQQQLLSEKEGQLADAQAVQRLNAALEEARGLFDTEEADVFRQGDKLLIRLKGMQFASGDAQIPNRSEKMLEKVHQITEKLAPSAVVVEGHTDATGSASVNQKLSQDRAETVAEYLAREGVNESVLEAVGYGFEKPITSNKSKAGRAQNRRVDIWISAGESTRAPASNQ